MLAKINTMLNFKYKNPTKIIFERVKSLHLEKKFLQMLKYFYYMVEVALKERYISTGKRYIGES